MGNASVGGGGGLRIKRFRRRRAQAARAAVTEVARFLRTEQIGGLVLLGATVLALIVANSPLSEQYAQLSAYRIGPAALHLNLSIASWAQDGLLTIFFVVTGLELKWELVVGELRNLRAAMLPIVGAIGGMVGPVVLCFAIAFGAPGGAVAWAVPVATDIAFALAVLAITARSLPPSLRVFLLTLAIVDDLGAIALIAVVFTAHLAIVPLLGAVAVLALYGWLQQRRFRGWWLYLPLAVAAWALVHASGVHATVAGICVPLFAFFAAGIVVDRAALVSIFTDRAALGVLLGLVVGKTVGVLGGTFIAVRSRLATLPAALNWRDLTAVAVLTGCGFTVSLLIAELAFPSGALPAGTLIGEQQDRIKGAVLVGSIIAALLAAALLRRRVRVHTG